MFTGGYKPATGGVTGGAMTCGAVGGGAGRMLMAACSGGMGGRSGWGSLRLQISHDRTRTNTAASAATAQTSFWLTLDVGALSSRLAAVCACKPGISPRSRSESALRRASRMYDMAALQFRFVHAQGAVDLHEGGRASDTIGCQTLAQLKGVDAGFQRGIHFLLA